jgi:hypothetical protein
MAITTRDQLQQEFAKGNGYLFPGRTITPGTTTAAAPASNNLDFLLHPNFTGTTLPTTLVDFPRPAAPPRDWYPIYVGMSANALNRTIFLAWLYKFGTVNLAATGNQITHDAATFPILRTRFGEASKPLTLIPLLYITTATTMTAPIFILQTNGGGTGYVDQDGNNVDGSVSFTCPNAATAAQSCYALRLETGDVGVRDIVQIDVTTAGTAGVADLWGMEIICPFGNNAPFGPWVDPFFGGLGPLQVTPGVATSGTATSKLCIVSMDNTTATTMAGWVAAAMNTA